MHAHRPRQRVSAQRGTARVQTGIHQGDGETGGRDTLMTNLAGSSDAEFDALTGAREERAAARLAAEHSDRLGAIIGGSLSAGLDVRLDRDQAIEELAVGRYVVARGRRARFFCMVTDVTLDSANPLLAKQPPDVSSPFQAEVHRGTTTFGTVH